jgi:hypothetical protein
VHAHAAGRAVADAAVSPAGPGAGIMIAMTPRAGSSGQRLLRRAVVATLAGGCVAVAAGCTATGHRGWVRSTYPVTPGHLNHPLVIGQGRLGDNTWTLRGDQDGDGGLCMGISWHPYAGVQDYGCGFGSNQVDDEGRGTEPIVTSATKDGSVLAFGPSPAGAVRAVLSMPTIPGTGCRSRTMPAMTVTIKHRLPSWYPVRGAGWFTTQVPKGSLDCVIDVTFLDAHGQPVRQPNTF